MAYDGVVPCVGISMTSGRQSCGMPCQTMTSNGPPLKPWCLVHTRGKRSYVGIEATDEYASCYIPHRLDVLRRQSSTLLKHNLIPGSTNIGNSARAGPPARYTQMFGGIGQFLWCLSPHLAPGQPIGMPRRTLPTSF